MIETWIISSAVYVTSTTTASVFLSMIRSYLIFIFIVKFVVGAAYIVAGMLTLIGLNHLELPAR